MKTLLTTTLCIVLSITSFAQDKYLSGVSDIEEFSNQVVQLFAKNEVSRALGMLSPYWPLPENELEALETKTLKYFNLFDESYGASIGTIKTREETIGDVAIRKTYLVRYGYTAVRLIFTYYLSQEGWLVNAFKWDNEFAEEFR
jgi:hypothetical protein